MTLFHFTSHLHIPYIKREGIAFGDIPITISTTQDEAIALIGEDTGVWLTNNPKADDYVPWCADAPVDKTAMRLTVEIPETAASRLWTWRDYANHKSVDPKLVARLEEVGGPLGCGLTWFIFKGIVLPEWITAFEEMRPRFYMSHQRREFDEYQQSADCHRCRIKI